jgi:hypothetical protein
MEEEVADIDPMPTNEDELANGLPELAGATGDTPTPLAPAVGASFPILAEATFPLAFEVVSMFTPGWSVDCVLGVCGYSLVASIGQIGAGGSGTPGASSASWGPALAITCPG